MLDDVKPVTGDAATVFCIQFSHLRQSGPLVLLDAVHEAIVRAFDTFAQTSACDEKVLVSVIGNGSAEAMIRSLRGKLDRRNLCLCIGVLNHKSSVSRRI